MQRVDEAGLKRIQSIEAAAYPPHMQQMQDCRDLTDLADYCECRVKDLRVLGDQSWYCLIAKHGKRAEVVDLAKVPGSDRVPWPGIVSALRKSGIRKVKLDAREGTSYELLCRYAPVLGCRIVSDSAWDWEGETMHEMVVKIKPLSSAEERPQQSICTSCDSSILTNSEAGGTSRL